MKRPSLWCGLLYQLLLRSTTPLMYLLLHLRFHGIENIPAKGPFIVCCNHRCILDPYMVAMTFRQHLYFMAKSELFTEHGHAAAAMLRMMGAFPVRRDSADRQSLHTALEVLRRGDCLGIFAQGRVVFDNAPFRAKSGTALLAAQASVPVIPVSIWCKGAWSFGRKVTIRIGKPISAKYFLCAASDRRKLHACAQHIADAINQQLSEEHRT